MSRIQKTMPIRNKHSQGFTIVELLIVIVVIGILAAITIVAYNGVTAKAQATRIVSVYNAVDKAMRLAATDQDWSTWPNDGGGALIPEDPSNDNLDMRAVARSSPLSPYLTEEVFPSQYIVRYDNDGDEHIDCGPDHGGASLYVSGGKISPAIAEAVNKMIDHDDDLTCGKISYLPNAAGNMQLNMYLSFTQDL